MGNRPLNSRGKLVRISILVDQETDERVRQLAISLGMTKTDIVRYALAETLPKLEQELQLKRK